MKHASTSIPSINPTEDEIAAFASEAVNDKPIVMVNLLRFNVEAQYPAGAPLAGDGVHCCGKPVGRYCGWARRGLPLSPPKASVGMKWRWPGTRHVPLLCV